MLYIGPDVALVTSLYLLAWVDKASVEDQSEQ